MKQLILSLIGVILWTSSIAQTRVEGKIYGPNGVVLPYAAIYLKKAKKATTSKIDGSFSLSIAQSAYFFSDTLICSYVGYQKYSAHIQSEVKVGEIIHVQVVLVPKDNILPEFEVVEVSLSAEEVVKKTIVNTRKNYVNESLQSLGYYRELIYEDEQPIEMHEALLVMNHARYPKKGFTKRAFKDYWSRNEFTMSYGASMSDVFRHILYFPSFVHHEDQIEIKAVRSSENLSAYGVNAAPVGGPLDLGALDKIKYQYDFLDPKLRNQYEYEKTGYLYYKGETCVIISFHPKKDYDNLIVQSFDKKQEHAIYQGEMYISVESWSLLKIKSQLSTSTDFSHYKGNPFIPYFVEFEVEYNSFNGKLILGDVKVSQSNVKSIGSKLVHYRAVRQLSLSNIQKPEYKLNDDYLIPIKHYTSLKNFDFEYSKEYWAQNKTKYNYSRPPGEFCKHLESKAPLSIQFERKGYPVDSISAPIIESNFINEILRNDCKIEDSDSIRKSELNLFLQRENLFTEQVFRKLLPERKTFYLTYLNLYPQDTLVKNQSPQDEYSWHQNEQGEVVLVYNISSDEKRVVFNYSQTGKGKRNFQLGKITFNDSKSHTIYSYSENGNAYLNLEIQNTNLEVVKRFTYVSEFEFLNDSLLLYTKYDSITYRVHELYMHRIGHNKVEDILVYREQEVGMGLVLTKSSSREYVFLRTESLIFTKNYLLNLQAGKINLHTLTELSESNTTVDHFGDSLIYISSNSMTNSTVSTTSVLQSLNFKPEIIYTSIYPIVDIHETTNYVLVAEYKYNSMRLNVVDKKNNRIHAIHLPDSIVSISFQERENYRKANIVVIDYQTPIVPLQQLKINVEDGSINIQDKILLEPRFSNGNYQCELLWFESEMGTSIPITVLYKKSDSDTDFAGMVVKTYGSYGALKYPLFDEEDFVYASQGIIVAFAHVRGGGELGMSWYYGGRLFNKINGIKDFIGATKFLQNQFGIKRKHTIGIGTSAGGVIMGYVANTEPELFGGLILDKPYLDLINTLKDANLPLSNEEYPEWGNPNDSIALASISVYSPYQNIRTEQKYPHMFIIAKYKDVQTPIWQVASSVIKLRSSEMNDRLLLFNTDFESGHNGSANFDIQIDEMSNKFGFIKYVLGR